VQVVAVAFAAGPAMLTAWMFILGTLGAARLERMLTNDSVMLGTVALALIGLALCWRKLRIPLPKIERRPALLSDERLLLVLIVAALVVRWFVIAYWPFTAYDSLWVYGYEGKLYALLGCIPRTIGYYPQFIPLQYTYAQLGGINDHVARASLIFLHIGSILAAYVLGSRLISRRTGLLAAAIWALYPHVGEWSRAGDLEIPLAFLFTLAAAFFLLAWRGATEDGSSGENPRRNALLAGTGAGRGYVDEADDGGIWAGHGLDALAGRPACSLRSEALDAASPRRTLDGIRGITTGRGVVHAQRGAGAAATGVSAGFLADAGGTQRRRVRLDTGGAGGVGGVPLYPIPTL
jgi:hypothetical protein